MLVNPITLSIPIFFLLITIEVIYDRLHNKNLYRLQDALTNISCGITEQVSGIFIKVGTVALYYFVFEHFRWFTLPNNALWGIVLFLGVDFCYYWAHRLSHEINLFWAGHVVHHQSEDYNLSVALRQGFAQKLFTIIIYLPLAFLGFSTELFLIFSAWNTLYQFWIHTETIGKLGPLEWVLNTPSHHRVHHGREPKYIDKNHAGVLIIWDRLFGTFQAEEERPVYGITTPANTWNPLYAQVQHFSNIWSDWRQVRGWDKIRLLYKKPGWLPDYAGGYRAPQAVDKSVYQKFTIAIPPVITVYVFTQYVLLLGISAWFLFEYKQLLQWQKIGFAIAIAYSAMSIGLLLEGKRKAFILEYIRLIALPVLVLLSIPKTDLLWLIFPVVTGIAFIWLGWAQAIAKKWAWHS